VTAAPAIGPAARNVAATMCGAAPRRVLGLCGEAVTGPRLPVPV